MNWMALSVWTQNSGYSLGVYSENTTIDISLPVQNDTGVSYQIIAGSLPAGLYINGNKIAGTVWNIVRNTVYSFCIRAIHKIGRAHV